LAVGDLTARVAASGPPELRRVGRELNRLAGRIQHLLTATREEAADLAHRLRTPAAALRLNIDSLADTGERTRLSADIDALTRLVDEVIRTARRPVREGAGAGADVARIAGDRVAYWSALAEDVGRPIEMVGPDTPLLVRASPEDLAAALDALLENVFSHTPDAAAVRVEVAPQPGGGATVTVEDAGPGFRPTPPVAAPARPDRPGWAWTSPAAPPKRPAAGCGPAPGRSVEPWSSCVSAHLNSGHHTLISGDRTALSFHRALSRGRRTIRCGVRCS
jgi:hypothetical protein